MSSRKCGLRDLAKRTSQTVAFGLVVGSLAAGTLVGSPGALASSESPCSSSVVGAHYNYQGVGGKQFSGDRYKVLVVNESCSTARKWVAKLTHASPGAITGDGANVITGAPMGWSCEGKGSTYTTHKSPTISGQCYQGTLINASKLFYWATDVS